MYETVFDPTALPLPRRMVIRRLSAAAPTISSCTSSSGILIGVRDRGFDRGRFKRIGDGLLFLSASGEVTASPVLRLKSGEECLMRSSSMDASAVLEAPGVASLCSGMLSDRCIRRAIARGLVKAEVSLLSFSIL